MHFVSRVRQRLDDPELQRNLKRTRGRNAASRAAAVAAFPDFDEKFFATDGLARLAAWLEAIGLPCGVVGTLGNCTRHGLQRADHLFHIRCELPAPNTIDLFEPFIDHPQWASTALFTSSKPASCQLN